MAAVTLRAVLAEMPVIFTMTGVALLRHLLRAGRFGVTVATAQLAVRTDEREMCITGVIERP